MFVGLFVTAKEVVKAVSDTKVRLGPTVLVAGTLIVMTALVSRREIVIVIKQSPTWF